MALQKLLFRPGVNRDSTNYNNEGGWYECDKIRFVSGLGREDWRLGKNTPLKS
jgi:hypothetical protein